MLRSESIYNRVEKLVSHCRNAYDLAKFHGQIESNPLDGILKYLDKGSKGNMKHVSLQELPDLVQSIRGYKNAHTAIALELLVILFPRPQELRYAKWQDFNFEKNIWIKPAAEAISIITAFSLPFYPKLFHRLPRHLLGRGTKKARSWRALYQNKFYWLACGVIGRAQTMLGWRDTSSSSTTASAGKKPRAKASCGSTHRRFCPSAPQGSPANSVT